MTLVEIIQGALSNWPSPVNTSDGVLVPTHCLYPSNGIVRVHVSGGQSAFKIHDAGGALEELETGGGWTPDQLYILKNAAQAQGLDVTHAGVIFSPIVNIDQLVGTVALVANVSKECAHALVARYRAVPKKNFRENLARFIDIERSHGRFLDVTPKRGIVGASNKLHKFDFEITFAGHQRLLLDAVTKEASSINAVLASNLDVSQAKLPNTSLRIVYDDDEDWKSSDLSLLALGAPVVPFSKLRPVLNRIAL